MIFLLQRVGATVSDYIFIVVGHVLLAKVFISLSLSGSDIFTMTLNLILSCIAVVIVFGFPIFYYGLCLRLLGSSAGKYLFGLRLSQAGNPANTWITLLREITKALAVFSGLGAIYAGIQIRQQKDTWYDAFMRCRVSERTR